MIEIKLIWIQMFCKVIVLWFALNVIVFIFNVCFFWGDDDQLQRTPLIATIVWAIIILVACIQLFVKVVP